MATLRDLAPGLQDTNTMSSLAPGLVAAPVSPLTGLRSAPLEDATAVMRPIERNSMSEAGKGWASTRLSNQANYLATEEAVRRAAGDVAGANALREQIAGLQQEAAFFAPQEQDITRIGLDPSRIANYALGAMGSVPASAMDGMLAGGGVGAAAKLAGLSKNPIAQAISKAAPYLAGGAAFVPNFATNTGETYNELRADANVVANTTPLQQALAAGGTGLIMGALDTLPELGMLHRAVGAGGKQVTKALSGGFGQRLAKDVGLEMGTEVAQTGVQKATHSLMNPLRDTSEDWREYANAAAQAGFGGLPMHGATNVVQNMRDRINSPGIPGLERGQEFDLKTGEKLGGLGGPGGESLAPMKTVKVGAGQYGSAKDIDARTSLILGEGADAFLDSGDVNGFMDYGAQRKQAVVEELSQMRSNAAKEMLAKVQGIPDEDATTSPVMDLARDIIVNGSLHPDKIKKAKGELKKAGIKFSKRGLAEEDTGDDDGSDELSDFDKRAAELSVERSRDKLGSEDLVFGRAMKSGIKSSSIFGRSGLLPSLFPEDTRGDRVREELGKDAMASLGLKGDDADTHDVTPAKMRDILDGHGVDQEGRNKLFMRYLRDAADKAGETGKTREARMRAVEAADKFQEATNAKRKLDELFGGRDSLSPYSKKLTINQKAGLMNLALGGDSPLAKLLGEDHPVFGAPDTVAATDTIRGTKARVEQGGDPKEVAKRAREYFLNNATHDTLSRLRDEVEAKVAERGAALNASMGGLFEDGTPTSVEEAANKYFGSNQLMVARKRDLGIGGEDSDRINKASLSEMHRRAKTSNDLIRGGRVDNPLDEGLLYYYETEADADKDRKEGTFNQPTSSSRMKAVKASDLVTWARRRETLHTSSKDKLNYQGDKAYLRSLSAGIAALVTDHAHTMPVTINGDTNYKLDSSNMEGMAFGAKKRADERVVKDLVKRGLSEDVARQHAKVLTNRSSAEARATAKALSKKLIAEGVWDLTPAEMAAEAKAEEKKNRELTREAPNAGPEGIDQVIANNGGSITDKKTTADIEAEAEAEELEGSFLKQDAESGAFRDADELEHARMVNSVREAARVAPEINVQRGRALRDGKEHGEALWGDFLKDPVAGLARIVSVARSMDTNPRLAAVLAHALTVENVGKTAPGETKVNLGPESGHGKYVAQQQAIHDELRRIRARTAAALISADKKTFREFDIPALLGAMGGDATRLGAKWNGLKTKPGLMGFTGLTPGGDVAPVIDKRADTSEAAVKARAEKATAVLKKMDRLEEELAGLQDKIAVMNAAAAAGGAKHAHEFKTPAQRKLIARVNAITKELDALGKENATELVAPETVAPKAEPTKAKTEAAPKPVTRAANAAKAAQKLSTRTFDDGDATTAERPQPRPTPSDASVEATKAQIKAVLTRILGKNIAKVDFSDLIGANGSWDSVTKIVTIGVSRLNPQQAMSVAYHEGMHAFFSEVLAKNPEAKALMLNVMKQPRIMNRLRELLYNSPAALKAIETDPEEALAYTFEFWTDGMINVGPKTQSFFSKVQRFFRNVMGLISDDEKAEEIFQALYDGKMAEPSAAEKAIHDAMVRGEKVKRMKQARDAQVQWAKSTALGAHRVMVGSGSKTAADLANLMWTNPGSVKGGTSPGVLNRRALKNNHYTNRLMKEVFAGLDDGEMKQLAELAHERAEPSALPADSKVGKALGNLYKLNADMWRYLRDSGMDVGSRDNGKYVPVAWDLDYLTRNEDKFVEMLVAHYPEKLREAQAAMLVLNPEAHSLEDIARMFKDTIVDRVGVDAKLALLREDGVLTPFFANENNRTFDWIAPEHRAEFLQKDLSAVMTAYINQGTRAAEYFRTFGQAGERLREMTKRKGDIVGRHPDGTLIRETEDGPVIEELRAQAEKENVPVEEREAWAQRRHEDVRRSVSAMEGTLGKDISDGLRKFNTALMVYQNTRLLPLSLFAAMLDPITMMSSGGKFDDAIKAYVRGFKGVFKAWKAVATNGKMTMDEDLDELNAMLAGTVDSSVYLEEHGQVHASEYMDGKMRKWNNFFFKLNGLSMWDRSMRIEATRLGMDFIRDNAAAAREGDAEAIRKLSKLGVKAEELIFREGRLVLDAKELAQWRAENDAGGAAKFAALTDRQKSGLLGKHTVPSEMAVEKAHFALQRFVQRGVLSPNAAVRPAWASDPKFAALFHLKQFTYSFHETTMRHLHEEFNDGNYEPAKAALLGVPVMIASDIVKALITGGGSLPGYMQSWGVADWLTHGWSRAGLNGIGQIAGDALDNPFSLLGPTVDQVVHTAMDPVGKLEKLDMVPGARVFRGAIDAMVRE